MDRIEVINRSAGNNATGTIIGGIIGGLIGSRLCENAAGNSKEHFKIAHIK